MSRLPILSVLVLFALLIVPSSIKGANLFRFDPSRGSPLFTSELADDDSGDSSEGAGQPNGDGFFLHLFQASSSSSRTGSPAAAAVSASKDLPFQSFDFNLDEQEEAREAVQRARLAKIAEMGAIPARVAPADGDEFDQQNQNQEPSTLTLFTTLNIALVFLATSIGFFIFALYRYPPVALMERVKGHLATRFQPI